MLSCGDVFYDAIFYCCLYFIVLVFYYFKETNVSRIENTIILQSSILFMFKCVKNFVVGSNDISKSKTPQLLLSGKVSAVIYMTASCGMFYIWCSCLDLPFSLCDMSACHRTD